MKSSCLQELCFTLFSISEIIFLKYQTKQAKNMLQT